MSIFTGGCEASKAKGLSTIQKALSYINDLLSIKIINK